MKGNIGLKKEKVISIFKNNKTRAIILIVLVSLFSCIPFFNKDLNFAYDDGVQHIARIIGSFNSIKNGQSTIITSELCNNFGYAWNLFYSPFTAYLPLIFLGVSFVSKLKFFILFVTIFTGIFMYQFVLKFVNNLDKVSEKINDKMKNRIAILAAVLYILSPYRLTDIYSRMALSEICVFMFLPLVFSGILDIFGYGGINKDKGNYMVNVPLVIGACGLVFCQSVIAMYVAIICFVLVLFKIVAIKNQVSVILLFKRIIQNLIVIIAISSIYWMPLLITKNSANYEVFNQERMIREDTLIKLKVNPLKLFYTHKDDIRIYQIGFVSLLGLLLTYSAFIQFKGDKKDKTDNIRINDLENKEFKLLYMFFLIMGILNCIFSLSFFPFEKLPSILKMIQFSFRLLTFSSFFFSIVAAINLVVAINIKRWYETLGVIVVDCLLTFILLNQHLIYSKDFNESILYNGVRVTKETGRVHMGCASFEYLPSKAFSNLEYIVNRKDEVIVLDGNAEINNYVKNGLEMSVNLKCEIDSIIEFPYIYYPGYEVKNGDKKFETFESEKGFLAIKVEKGFDGKIELRYTNELFITPIIIGSITIIGCICLYFLESRRIKK